MEWAVSNVDEAPVRVDAEHLTVFVATALERLGLRPADARTVAEVMVEADRRGVESHGVAAMMSQVGYARMLREGRYEAQPEIRQVVDRAGISVWDGGGGFGMIVGVRAMRHALDRAAEHGVHIAIARNSRHFGMAGYYALMALERGMIGWASTNASPGVAPTFGREAVYGTNPIAFAAPAGSEEPFVLDMATSAVAFGKIGVYARHGRPIPLGWAGGPDGLPTADAHLALDTRVLMPLGSTPELSSYKGYGLAMLVEILCGALAGGPMMPPRGAPVSHFFLAIDPGQAVELADYEAQMDDLLLRLKASTPAEGAERVLVAGEREFAHRRDAVAHGIPLHPQIVADLNRLGGELGIGGMRVLGDE
jgi:LDH2 family malate/lactate/ureidoglycolate dehydrogenase